MMAAYTFCVSSFPVLLPEIGSSLRLADAQLGVVAGAFGLGRMLSDIPAGLLVTHHARRALLAGPAFIAAGAACVAAASGFHWLVLGQALVSLGYTLANMASVTLLLRERTRLSDLNVFELSAMVAVLAAVTLVGLLPPAIAWNAAYVLGCLPLVIGLVALRGVLARLPPTDPTRPWFARAATGTMASSAPRRGGMTAALAFIAGGTIAITYTTLASFLLPLRGSREFGLERAGISRLLMLVQTCDILALIPVGRLADRLGLHRVLAAILLTVATALTLIGFGALPHVVAGCVLFGLGMAGWMLPLGLLRSATPASSVAWRTALYRVGVDGGMFLGPLLSGLLWATHPGLLPGAIATVLVLLAVALLARRGARSLTA
jgi:DHA1 family multidrug resistance protein-like MFS transporter